MVECNNDVKTCDFEVLKYMPSGVGVYDVIGNRIEMKYI